MTAIVRLDIGCGDRPAPGFTPVDIKHGQAAYPLSASDGSVDEIRASHILEHFPHGQISDVLADWVRALKPGGLLRIAVPDFQWIAEQYLAGENIPVEGYIMGGQVDAHDYHRSIFDAEALGDALAAAGLVGVTRWTSEQQDCAALPVSLNIQGTKPPETWPTVAAVMSTPRLGWNDMWGCALETLGSMGIKLTKHTGAFWEQCITRAIDEALTTGPAYILTLDYDTVFSRADVQSLIVSAMRNPHADAIAAIQVHRTKQTPLLTIGSAANGNETNVPCGTFSGELARCRTAHFGLTLIRADKLRELQQPWFHGKPSDTGTWDDDRTDPDVGFWRRWESTGNSLYVANRVPVGHIEVMIRWPGRNMLATYQHPSDYHATGKPEDVWR